MLTLCAAPEMERTGAACSTGKQNAAVSSVSAALKAEVSLLPAAAELWLEAFW